MGLKRFLSKCINKGPIIKHSISSNIRQTMVQATFFKNLENFTSVPVFRLASLLKKNVLQLVFWDCHNILRTNTQMDSQELTKN